MSDHATLVEIAAALGVSKRAADRRAKNGKWPYMAVPVRGGQQYRYDLDAMPRAISRKVRARRAIAAIRAEQIEAADNGPDEFLVVMGDEVFQVRRIRHG